MLSYMNSRAPSLANKLTYHFSLVTHIYHLCSCVIYAFQQVLLDLDPFPRYSRILPGNPRVPPMKDSRWCTLSGTGKPRVRRVPCTQLV